MKRTVISPGDARDAPWPRRRRSWPRRGPWRRARRGRSWSSPGNRLGNVTSADDSPRSGSVRMRSFRPIGFFSPQTKQTRSSRNVFSMGSLLRSRLAHSERPGNGGRTGTRTWYMSLAGRPTAGPGEVAIFGRRVLCSGPQGGEMNKPRVTRRILASRPPPSIVACPWPRRPRPTIPGPGPPRTASSRSRPCGSAGASPGAGSSTPTPAPASCRAT